MMYAREATGNAAISIKTVTRSHGCNTIFSTFDTHDKLAILSNLAEYVTKVLKKKTGPIYLSE